MDVTRPPRLAVVGDVLPCATQGGELLLYRLLADYPAEKLVVIHGGRSPYYDAGKTLPGVRYEEFAYGYALPRPLRSRWLPFWRALELSRMTRHAGRLAELLAAFRPEAVLTVTDAVLWRTAAAVAERLRLPLYLIQHDDLASKFTGNSPKARYRLTRWLMDREVGRAYRQAAERFCVSPGMAECYQEKFGPPARVLYPSRGEDSPEPRVRVRPAAGGPPVVAFAGALYTEGARVLLRRLAAMLAGLGGELHLYTRNDPKEYGLDVPGARVVGFLPPRQMAERMGETSHALFLPASFLPDEATDVATLFPSKLADYTAVGLPVLVWGPDHSSAVRWGRENPAAAVTVADPDGAGVPDLLRRLAGDPDFAADVARHGLAAGERDFSPGHGRAQLLSALRNPSATPAEDG